MSQKTCTTCIKLHDLPKHVNEFANHVLKDTDLNSSEIVLRKLAFYKCLRES